MARPPFRAATAGGRAMRLAPLLLALVSAALVPAVSSDGAEAGTPAAISQQQPAGGAPDTTVLCVSKCGTCPVLCSSPPEGAGDSTAPPKPRSVGGGYSSPSPPAPATGQSKGAGRPSNYYYFFTSAAGGRTRTCCAGAAAVYASSALAVLGALLL